MKPKPNWKKRALEAEIERDYWKEMNDAAMEQLAARPTLEKIVEKEVLPWWVVPIMVICLGGWVGLTFGMWTWRNEFKPSPIYVNRVSENRSPWGRLVPMRGMQPVMDKSHRKRVRTRPRLTDCAPGFEPVGGVCAEVNGKTGHEMEKDELGYPK